MVDDPEFLTKAMYGLGKLTRQGVPIVAKTGYYLNDVRSQAVSRMRLRRPDSKNGPG